MRHQSGFTLITAVFLAFLAFSHAFGELYEFELSNGKTATGIEIVRMTKGKTADTATTVSIVLPDQSKRTVSAKTIREIRDANGSVVWKFDSRLNALVAADNEAEDESSSASKDKSNGESGQSGDGGGIGNEAVLIPATGNGPKTKPKRADSETEAEGEADSEVQAAETARLAAEAKLPYAVRFQKNYDSYRKTGVLLWTDLDLPEYRRRLEEQRTQIKDFQKTFPRLKSYETRYFILVSDAPPAVFRHIVLTLDNMYALLCKSFGIPKIEEGSAEDLASQLEKSVKSTTGTDGLENADEDTDEDADVKKDKKKKGKAKQIWKNIWQAKCTVVVFMNESDFNRFEMQYYQTSVPPTIRGLCHQNTFGNVLISCKSTENPLDFYAVLVHETTHGFVWMHRSAKSLPTWLNEGIAEWCSGMIVTQSKSLPLKQRAGLDRIKQTGSLDGLFVLQDIAAWQYGIASMMTDTILKSNPKVFIELINGIKSGEDPQECLKKYYKVDYEQFARVFGRRIGVPGLRM